MHDGGAEAQSSMGDATSPVDAADASDAVVVLPVPDGGGTITLQLEAGALALCNSCPAGQKLCSFGEPSTCTPKDDPFTGCASCGAACTFPHAAPTCAPDGTCAIGSCEPGWLDADGNPSNGCEAQAAGTAPTPPCTPPLTQCGNECVDLATSTANCGACGLVCPAQVNAFPACSGGVCGQGACFAGTAPCNGRCLDLEIDWNDCGACGHACPDNGSCSAGQCVCVPGWTLCGTACVATQIDDSNCGACGNACGTGELCAGSHCIPSSSIWLATGLSTPEDIVVDGINAYFTDPTAGTVSSVPKNGGPVTPLAQGQQKPRRIAMDSTYVYWTNNLGGAVMRARKDGSAMPAVFSTAASPVAITVVPGGPGGCAGVPVYLSCAPASDNSGLLVVWSPQQSVVYDGFTIIIPRIGDATFPSLFVSVDPRTWSTVAIPWNSFTDMVALGSAFDSNNYYIAGGEHLITAERYDKATNRQVQGGKSSTIRTSAIPSSTRTASEQGARRSSRR
jgi:hypothetical protein